MAKSSLKVRRAARKGYQKAARTSRPGAGARFAALERSARAGGARNPAGVAAAMGRRKYGAKRFAGMAAAGRKRR